jgi:alpha-L-fucosidase
MLVKRKLDPKLQWFPRARFGMFIHFGLYALLGRGEWVMYDESIPREKYEKLARRFNPRRFNADEWVAAARAAGARYITVTAKHHDGFCLFNSALTDYKITRTPFGRDLIGELVAACHRAHMRIMLYYSQPDWHHPNFVHRKGAFKDLQYERPDDRPDWPAYQRYLEGQVLELCTMYGRIDGIWFDGVHKTEREWRGGRLYRLIKKHQPAAVVNERAGFGDFFTPERRFAGEASAAGYTVESCQSICKEAWGYQRDATLYSSSTLIRSLVRMAASGGNYLLNIGPKPDGSLPADQVARLLEIGGWLRQHGKAIHGTEGCPSVSESERMLYTRKRSRLYLHLLDWPDTDALTLRRLRTVPIAAHVLTTGERIRIESSGDGVRLGGLPSLPPDPASNVIELTFRGLPVLGGGPVRQASRAVLLEGRGRVVLTAKAALRTGFGPKGGVISLESLADGRAALGCWTSPEQAASWHVVCARRQRCRVSVVLRCEAPYHASSFAVRAAGQALAGKVPATKGETFGTVPVGVLELSQGEHRIELRPVKPNYGYVFATVREILLSPER